jgi:hypothetical protein
MKLLEMVVGIDFLSYLEQTNSSMCNKVDRFVRILEDQWKIVEKRDHYFQCSK